MNYKQIEASRKIRLWIGQVIVPAVGVGAMLMANPEIKTKAEDKLRQFKEKHFKKS